MVTFAEPLWAELINSDWRDYRGSGAREDRIDSAAWLEAFLRRTGWDRGGLPSGDERKALRRLRSLLARMVDALLAGGPVAAGDRAALNRVLARAPVVRELAEAPAGVHSVRLLAAARGIAAVAGAVAATFADLLAEGDVSRVGRCANPDCGWVIYDASRSRTRRWCNAAECGNLIKVRRFRERRRRRGHRRRS